MKLPVIALVVVVAVALAVRLTALALLLPVMKPDVDMDSYHSLARNIAAGKGFVAPAPTGAELPNVSRTPVYPLFLAALIRLGGDRLGLFLAVQCVLGAATCLLTVMLASRWLSRLGATVAGLMMALDPNSVLRCVDLRTDTLFTLLLVAGMCLLVWRMNKLWAWGGVGLLWSLATLCRPIAVWLWVIGLIAAVLYIPTWQKRCACFLVLLTAHLPLEGVWAARNAALTGRWFISTIAIHTLHMSQVAGVRAEQTGQSLEAVQREFEQEYGDVQFVADRAGFVQQLQRIQRHSAEVLASAPSIVARQTIAGWTRVLFGPGIRGLENSLRDSKPSRQWWGPVYGVCLVVWLLASVVGVISLRREAILPALLALYFVGLAAGPGVNSRYRVPATPMMAVLAVAGVKKLRKQK